MNEIETKAGLAPTPGYRYASIVGDRIYLAGQVPLNSRGAIHAAGDPGGQATRCLFNLQAILACHDFALEDIRHLTVYVVGSHQNLNVAWQAILEYFHGEVPPATLVGVALLGYEDQLVEIDPLVVRDPDLA